MNDRKGIQPLKTYARPIYLQEFSYRPAAGKKLRAITKPRCMWK